VDSLCFCVANWIAKYYVMNIGSLIGIICGCDNAIGSEMR
jgi:hypothetical protein